MSETTKYFCPRLLDYIVIVGSRHPNHNNNVAQTPELLRRYPLEDHQDFPLSPDIIFFCQPEGCISVGPKRMSLRETTSFVFTLTEKDSGKVRYGICVNFFRPIERKWDKSGRIYSTSVADGNGNLNVCPDNERQRSPRSNRRQKTAGRVRNNTLTSLCIVSHHPFFSTFRECLFILRRLIDACHDRSCTKRIGGSRSMSRDTVWGVLTGQGSDNLTGLVMHEVKEIETWILRLLSAPVPVPGKTRVEVQVLPKDMQPPLLFALPDHTRFTLIDFPLHLPLELLGVDTCLKVLTAIMLEYKVVMQSRDYNALSMSVMAFVSMLYPLEYMFPVIPLLPTCMSSAEQLLLAPTPFIIGVPASFFPYKNDFKVPDDVWVVDLDSNKMTIGRNEELPPLPEPEGTHLRNHLKQALASMSMTPQPIKNLDALAQNPDQWKRRESFSSQTGFNPLIYGNDVDSVDVATRVAMIRFFNSANTLGNFSEHTRTLRLYPRPVVAFQVYSFLKSRPARTHFTARLARTQAVEYYAEWSLCPKNVVFLRVQTSVYDPLLIGDKPKWYAHQLQPIEFRVYDEYSSLGAALSSAVDIVSDEYPTDESGSDSDGADSTSSSYSSLSDFVTDMMNSEIDGDTPAFLPEHQVLVADESKVYSPPDKLQLPETSVTTSDSALSVPDSDASSSDSDSPSYSSNPLDPVSTDIKDVASISPKLPNKGTPNEFRYDSGNAPPTSRALSSTTFARTDSIDSNSSTPEMPKRPALAPLTQSLTSAFEAYEKPTRPPRSPKLSERLSASDTSGFHSLSIPPSSPRKLSSSTRSSPGIKSFTGEDNASDRASTPSSLISTISNELTDIAQSASSTVSELFGSSTRSPHPSSSKPAKPFAPLGNRKALVEKSGLVKHAATNKKHKESHKASQESRNATNSENQQFLKEVVTNVLEGQGVSWLKLGRIRKLMEDENYRNFVVSRLNKNLDKKLADDTPHIEDMSLTKPLYKGMMTLVKSMVHGLEHTYQNHGLGGMASAYMLLEIIHTHYWAKELVGTGSNKSDSSHTPEITSPSGSHENLSIKSIESPQKSETQSLNEDQMVASLGSPVIVNGEEFENIEIESFNELTMQDSNPGPEGRMDQNSNTQKYTQAGHRCEVVVSDADTTSPTTQLDVMRQMVKNKEMMKANPKIDKRCSIESEMSEFSSYNKRSRSGGLYGSKSSLSTGYRYNDGRMISTSPQLQSPEGPKVYLFEGLIGKDRSRLWDQMQFWEDVFLDAVAQERDIIGMDQGPGEMMDRYNSLGNGERRRLEHDEDKLLAYMLYNIVAFMVMMRVHKQEIRKKIRRLLGKSHIGLAYSADVNNLLDQINNLHGNDIDLRPMGSRFMQKQSFTVHWGGDNTGDMLFMEVCDDCIILRSVTGAICDRWWYEKLVNMTYCPKTKVLCLWRKHGEKVQLNQFYTKKCRELYFCVKESMEKAAARNNGKLPGPELGGEFPVTDMKSGQGGLLQVCMEGIGLLLANSKLFIELGRIKKCFTQKGGIFVLEEFDSKTKKVTQHKFKSRMANRIALGVHRVFTIQHARFTRSLSDPQSYCS